MALGSPNLVQFPVPPAANDRRAAPDFRGLMLKAAAELRVEATTERNPVRHASLQRVAGMLTEFANEC